MAGAKVRGITIELTADTTGILKGLKEVNSQTRQTQSQLKDVQRLLKLNPTNITLLKQQTQLLQQQITNTKNKLEQLKKAEAQMRSEGIDENSEQFQALQREIIATEEQLKQLEKTAGSGSARLLQISNATKAFGEKAESAGKKMLPLSAGIVGLGTVAVKTAADFDEQMSKVSAISGATGDDFQQLEDKAREMGSKTKFSASEAAEGFEYMAMAGWKTADMLEGIEPILNLAAASGEELGTTSDIVTDAMTAFGLSAEDAGHFADVLASASSNANTNVSMLGESFKYAAPVAGALGYSVDDVAVALGLMANSGVKASSAGTALRTLLTNMSKPTDAMASAMEQLGVSLDDGQGNMKSFREVMIDLRNGFKGLKTPSDEAMTALANLDKELEDGTITEKQYNKMVKEWTKSTYGAEGALKAEAAASLAGKQGMSGLLAIVNASEEDFNSLTDAIDNSQGTAKKMADTMQDNLAGQLTILKSQLQELAISFGKILMPLIQKAVGHIQNLVDKFNNLTDEQKKTIAKIAGVVAAIAPALIVLGKFSKAISAITSAMSTLKFASFITNPVTIAIGAVAGLAVGFAKLWDHIEKSNGHLGKFADKTKDLKNKNDELQTSIKKTTRETEDAVTQSLAEADTAERLAEKLETLAQKENKTAGEKEQIKQLVEQLNELVPDLNLAYDAEKDALSGTNEQIMANIALRKEQAKLDAYTEGYTESLKQAAQAEINLSDAQAHFNEMLSAAGDDVREHYEQWKKFGELGVPWDGIEMAKYRDDMVKLTDADKAVATAQGLVTQANKNADLWYQKTEQSAGELATTQQKTETAMNAMNLEGFRTELQNTLGNKYKAKLDQAITQAQQTGTKIPDELKSGILSGEVDVKEATRRIRDLVKENLASGNDAFQRGQEWGQGYMQGLESMGGAIGEAVERLIREKVNDVAKNTQKSGSPSRMGEDRGEEYGEGYAIGLIDQYKNVANAARGLIQSADANAQGKATMTANRTTTPNGVPSGGAVNNYTYTQNNYSPSHLSESDIYRQTNNLLNLKGATV